MMSALPPLWSRRCPPLAAHGRRFIGFMLLLTLLLAPFRLESASATLSLSPSSGTYTEGETFSVRVLVTSSSQAINAAEATVSFPNDKLEAKAVSKSGSVFTLWAVEPASSNANGTVNFSGGLPNPGYQGSGGRVLTVTFKAKSSGTAKVTIGGAQVLANDGQGTNIFSGAGSATFTIKKPAPPPEQPPPSEKPPEEQKFPAPLITSSTHPDQRAWYAIRDMSASIVGGAGVIGYSVEFDQNAGTTPPETSSGSDGAFRRTGVADGVWYLHARAQYAGGWSSTWHHAFRIDATPPDPFSLSVEHPTPGSRQAGVTFATTDTTAGIARYELRLDTGDFQAATSPATLNDLLPGTHEITVRAIDLAGNQTEAKASFDVVGPQPPTASLIAEPLKAYRAERPLPTILAGTPLVLSGFARPTDTVRIVVRSTESVFEFPVAEIVDPAPIEPAPPGLTAWKVEIRPDLAPGEHTIHVTTIDPAGNESAEAPVIEFLVVTNVARFGTTLVPYRLIVKLLIVFIGLLLMAVGLLIIAYRRLRRRLREDVFRLK